MKGLAFLSILVGFTVFGASCGGSVTGPASDSPTEAYKRLYAAVKSKNTEEIKKNLTKNSVEFGKFTAGIKKAPFETAFENGMTETTLSSTLPRIRDERVNGTMGAIEVWNTQGRRWEDLPFILEDGAWKLAMGEAFSGTYKSPGVGRDLGEREAANAMKPLIPTPDVNTNPANSQTNRPLLSNRK